LTTARDTITTAITNKAVTPATDVSALATTVQLTSARDTITTAITNKAVTPATDTSSLPTKTDLSSTQTAITTAIANKVVEVELPPITIAPEDIATGIDASEKITRIDSQVALAVDRLTPAPELNINSRVNAGTIEIDRGDDYVSGDIPLPFTGRDLTSADSVKIHITKINRPNVDLLAVDTPVSNPGASNQTIQVVLSDAQTSALPVGFLRYEVKAVFGAESKTLFGGTLDVK
jgi:hypothetical protein